MSKRKGQVYGKGSVGWWDTNGNYHVDAPPLRKLYPDMYPPKLGRKRTSKEYRRHHQPHTTQT